MLPVNISQKIEKYLQVTLVDIKVFRDGVIPDNGNHMGTSFSV